MCQIVYLKVPQPRNLNQTISTGSVLHQTSLVSCNSVDVQYSIEIQGGGGPKVSLHTFGLIPTSYFILEGCCFADGILYLLVRGFRRQNLKIRIS